MPYFGIFGLEFEKILSYLKPASLNLSCSNVLWKNKNPEISDQKAMIGYFWDGIWKWYYHIWNEHPRNCLVINVCGKMKMPKLETKNALHGYFSTGIRKKYFHIWSQLPWLFLVVKFDAKLRILKLGLKIPDLKIFGLEFKSSFDIFEIRPL